MDAVNEYLQSRLAEIEGTTEETVTPEEVVEASTPEVAEEVVQAPTPQVDVMQEMLTLMRQNLQPAAQPQVKEPEWVDPYEREGVLEELARLETSYDLEDKKQAIRLRRKYDAEISQRQQQELIQFNSVLTQGQQQQNTIVQGVRQKFSVSDDDVKSVRGELIQALGGEAQADHALATNPLTQNYFRSRLVALAAERPTPASVPAVKAKPAVQPVGAQTTQTKPAEKPKKADTEWIHGPKDENYNSKLYQAMFGRKK